MFVSQPIFAKHPRNRCVRLSLSDLLINLSFRFIFFDFMTRACTFFILANVSYKLLHDFPPPFSLLYPYIFLYFILSTSGLESLQHSPNRIFQPLQHVSSLSLLTGIFVQLQPIHINWLIIWISTNHCSAQIQPCREIAKPFHNQQMTVWDLRFQRKYCGFYFSQPLKIEPELKKRIIKMWGSRTDFLYPAKTPPMLVNNRQCGGLMFYGQSH